MGSGWLEMTVVLGGARFDGMTQGDETCTQKLPMESSHTFIFREEGV